MRRFPYLAFICTLSLVIGEDGIGVPPTENGKGKKREKGHTSRFFENLDADHDGSVTRDEFNQARRIQELEEEVRDRLFARLDKNSDGTITRQEIKPQKKGNETLDSSRLLRQADKNRDRIITLEEFTTHPRFAKLPEKHRKDLFDRLDRNKDGMIDPNDRPKGGDKNPWQVFREFDTDEDKSLTFEEFLKMPHLQKMPEKARRKNFDRLDQDLDGKLSLKEFRIKPEKRGREGQPKKEQARKPAK